MPRHDESHVAIPMLAGLLLLVWARHGPLRQGTMCHGTM